MSERTMPEDEKGKDDYILGLSRRGIHPEDVCKKCSGLGIKLYGSTATWHGGVGGASMTKDVCDACWGSGSKARPWPSWKETAETKMLLENCKRGRSGQIDLTLDQHQAIARIRTAAEEYLAAETGEMNSRHLDRTVRQGCEDLVMKKLNALRSAIDESYGGKVPR